MADVSKLRLDNVTYDIKDDNARKYLVMVNEEPVSATKMVVETGGDAIELALQEDVDELEVSSNNLNTFIKNKNIAIFGDSFSDENIDSSTGYSNVWVKHFRNMVEPLGATITNYANAGSGYVQAGDSGSVPTKLASADLSNIDTVIIFAGLNDFRNGVWPSRPSNPPNYTFWKGLTTTSAYLVGKNVFIVTPMTTVQTHNSLGGFTLEFYRVVLASWAKYNGFMLINGPLVPQFGVGSSAFTGIHPKDSYSHLIAEYIYKKICSAGEPFSETLEYAVNSNISGVTNVSSARTAVYVANERVYIEVSGTLNANSTGTVPLNFCPILSKNLVGEVLSTGNQQPIRYVYSSGAPNSYTTPTASGTKLTLSTSSTANEVFTILLDWNSDCLSKYYAFMHS